MFCGLPINDVIVSKQALSAITARKKNNVDLITSVFITESVREFDSWQVISINQTDRNAHAGIVACFTGSCELHMDTICLHACCIQITKSGWNTI